MCASHLVIFSIRVFSFYSCFWVICTSVLFLSLWCLKCVHHNISGTNPGRILISEKNKIQTSYLIIMHADLNLPPVSTIFIVLGFMLLYWRKRSLQNHMNMYCAVTLFLNWLGIHTHLIPPIYALCWHKFLLKARLHYLITQSSSPLHLTFANLDLPLPLPLLLIPFFLLILPP